MRRPRSECFPSVSTMPEETTEPQDTCRGELTLPLILKLASDYQRVKPQRQRKFFLIASFQRCGT
jgi:hypothetical protein